MTSFFTGILFGGIYTEAFLVRRFSGSEERLLALLSGAISQDILPIGRGIPLIQLQRYIIMASNPFGVVWIHGDH
jgi:hypothetical protein